MSLQSSAVEAGVTRIFASSWQGRAVGYSVSAYVIDDVMIDTCYPRIGREILAAAQSLGVRGAVVTHSHEDHAGNVDVFANAGLAIWMHPECEAVLRAPPPIGAYRRIVWSSPRSLIGPLRSFDPAPLEVIHTPGHTDDHCVVWDAERGIVVSGDLFLGVKVRIAHTHESPSKLLHSLRKVAALEPRLVLDAHRGPVTNGAAMLRAKISWLSDRVGEISDLHRCGIPATEIRRRVLGAEPLVGYVSFGEYSKLALVRAVIRETGEVSGVTNVLEDDST